ncbi:MAG: sulfatase-like hydrolase/transferase [Deltaproteobacteria bacterium]|nr:sulfatase-like hydrolase/transferase [Deltaproteobacteria bacterium]
MASFHKARPSKNGHQPCFLDELAENTAPTRKPPFAFLHTVDPHDPHTPQVPFLTFKKVDKKRERFAVSDEIRLQKSEGGLSREDIEYVMALYDCEILHNDFSFNEFLAILKKKGWYEDSFVVLISDHGEQFDEHGVLFHGSSIYNEEIHEPLLVKFPRQEFAGYQYESYVSQVDILPTILACLRYRIPSEVDGRSLI